MEEIRLEIFRFYWKKDQYQSEQGGCHRGRKIEKYKI